MAVFENVDSSSHVLTEMWCSSQLSALLQLLHLFSLCLWLLYCLTLVSHACPHVAPAGSLNLPTSPSPLRNVERKKIASTSGGGRCWKGPCRVEGLSVGFYPFTPRDWVI